MSELIEAIREELKDEETRHIYADDLLNTYIATQIKVLREERGWTQEMLAQKAGMRQERISVLEDVNYQSWTASVLKRLARAFDVHLSIKFESFGTYLKDFANFNRKALERPSFADDPAFKQPVKKKTEVAFAGPPYSETETTLKSGSGMVKGGRQNQLQWGSTALDWFPQVPAPQQRYILENSQIQATAILQREGTSVTQTRGGRDIFISYSTDQTGDVPVRVK